MLSAMYVSCGGQPASAGADSNVRVVVVKLWTVLTPNVETGRSERQRALPQLVDRVTSIL